jgi:ribose 1,5-bisphosphokinase
MTASASKIGPGRFVLVMGPSGAGKDTLIAVAKRLVAPDVVFPTRVVTRPPSQFEENSYMAPPEFDAALANGEFALHWLAHDNAYGIPRQIDDDIRLGKTVVINVSRTIIPEARERYRNVMVVMITAPPEVLAARLANRGRASDTSVAERVQRAALPDVAAADLVISNVGSAEAHGRELAGAIMAGRSTNQ